MMFNFGAVESEQSLHMNPHNLVPFPNQLYSVCNARLSLLQELIT